MAVCPLCGKKMGILENQISEFEGDRIQGYACLVMMF